MKELYKNPKTLMWLVAVSSVISAILIIYKMPSAFILNGINNIALIARNFYIGEYAQTAMFVVFFGLNVWGYIQWVLY